jgi:hypothetical protein
MITFLLKNANLDRNGRWRGSILAAILGLTAMHVWAQTKLITEEEAQLPNSPILETRGITRGPLFKDLGSGAVNAKSFTLNWLMEARGSTKINPSTLSVLYLKQPIVDLTPRVKPGFVDDRVVLPNVSVPAGEHTIMIKIKDTDGREGSHVLRLIAK